MEITLQFVDPELWPHPPGWTAVGLVGHLALAYDPERRPHLIGEGEPQPLDRDAVNSALAPAIEAAATKLWIEGWTYALAESFGLNRRGLQRDRLAKNGLPPAVLRELGAMSCHDDAEGIGRLAHALAWYADRCSDGGHPVDRLADAERGALNALASLREVRGGRVTRPTDDPDK